MSYKPLPRGRWAWSIKPPWHIGSCPVCGCLVLLVPFRDGRLGVLDPPFAQRRWLRSILAPRSLLVQGFANLIGGSSHLCPAPVDCLLPRAESRAAAYRIARRYSKGGPN